MNSKKNIDKIVSLNKYFDKIVSSKENAQKYLIALGTNNKSGKLRKHYDY